MLTVSDTVMTDTAPERDVMPQLSVIVPCYNSRDYVPRCLDSLLTQTADTVEIVCVNDGSDDGTGDVLRSYQEVHPGKVVVIEQANAGAWAARWTGIQHARGRYTAFLDSDDTADEGFAASLLSAAQTHDADMAVCGYRRIDEHTGAEYSTELCDARPDFAVEKDPGSLLTVNTALWNKLIRTDLLRSVEDLANPPCQLEDVCLLLLLYERMHGTVTFVPKPLVNYHVREGSTITTVTPEAVGDALAALTRVKERYEAQGASAQHKELLADMAFLHVGVSMSYRLARDADRSNAKSIAKSLRAVDRAFPEWRHSAYLKWGYAWSHGPSHTKLYVASLAGKLRLLSLIMRLFGWLKRHGRSEVSW